MGPTWLLWLRLRVVWPERFARPSDSITVFLGAVFNTLASQQAAHAPLAFNSSSHRDTIHTALPTSLL